MLNVVRNWVDRYFSDEEAIVLLFLLVAGFGVIIIWGDILAPVIASIILAFILQGAVSYLNVKGLSNPVSVATVFVLFIVGLIASVVTLFPLIYSQIVSLVNDLPKIADTATTYTRELLASHASFISTQDVDQLYAQATSEVATFLQWLVSSSLQSLPVVISAMIYMIVVPLLLFFFLKDKDAIFAYISKSLPSNRSLMTGVWEEMNEQFANYLRGKVVEIMVVGIATYAIFALFGLNYALLLAIIVGLSVVIPYIGAVVVTIPVTLIAMFQFGFEASFYYVVGGYLLIQILDGNVLVPLLFSEVVNLHPSVIIMAVIFFGGVWGLWGIFFAIPLATLFKAVLHAWPTREQA
jgi:putative permease